MRTEVTQREILIALHAARGNVALASRALDMAYSSLFNRLGHEPLKTQWLTLQARMRAAGELATHEDHFPPKRTGEVSEVEEITGKAYSRSRREGGDTNPSIPLVLIGQLVESVSSLDALEAAYLAIRCQADIGLELARERGKRVRSLDVIPQSVFFTGNECPGPNSAD